MPIRETFWNIPHWAEIGQYVLGVLAVLICAYGLARHARRWRQGRRPGGELRLDQIGARLRTLLAEAVGQFRTAQDAYAGVMHLSIYWGMTVLLLGTILATVDWDVTRLFFGFQFLTDGLYVVYELLLDIFGLLVLIGLGLAAYRRYIMRPARLREAALPGQAWDDAYALGMLALIVVSGYLVEGLRIAVVQPDWAAWSPVGSAVAWLFSSLGDPTNRDLHLALWIGHGLVAFGFIASLPYTKLFHLLAAPLNIFFGSTRPAGELAPARADGGGARTWRDLSWKQLLDAEACVRCGRCQDNCPAYASGLALSPRSLMQKIQRHMWEPANGHALNGDVVTAEEVWACTACRACAQVCPILADPLAAVVDLRRHLVVEGQMDGRLQEALANLARYGNSFGQSERGRARWSQPIQPKLKDARREPVDYLWFVGDYASFNTGLADVTRKTAEVFRRAGLDFGLLYEAERNAGNDARRAGEEGLFEMLRAKNAAALEKCQFKAVVTTDPHTYNTLKHEYGPALNGGRPVLHHAELLDQLITSGQLKLGRPLGRRVTYHDPCYLGRYNGVYAAPRRVIAATGCRLVEMPRHGAQALCCGAGGGRIWMDEGQAVVPGQRPSEARLHEAAALDGVEVLVVACPKDVSMYRDAVKTAGYEGRLEVRELAELVQEAL